MLLLDSALEVAGVTLYRDHLDRGTYYYLPGSPRIVASENKFGLELIRFRGQESAGGFLFLDVALSHDEEKLQQVNDSLSQQLGIIIKLVPVLFDEGTVRLTTLGIEQTGQTDDSDNPDTEGAQSSAFIEAILGTATPSLLGQQRAVFTVELDQRGATIFEQVIAGGGNTPIMVVYQLAFKGIRAFRGIRATVKYHMAYDYLRTRVKGNSLIFKADLDREAESLKREGHIEIEDIDYQGSDPQELAKRDEQVRLTLSELSEMIFFRPATSPRTQGIETIRAQPAVNAAWQRQGMQSAAFSLRSFDQNEEQELRYNYTETSVATVTVAPQGMLLIPPSIDKSSLIIESTLDWPPAVASIQVFTPQGVDWTGVKSVIVDIRNTNELRSLVISSDNAEQSTTIANGELEYRLKVNYETEANMLGDIGEEDETFQSLNTFNLMIDPMRLSQRRMVRVSLGVYDPDVIKAVEGKLIVNSQEQAFMLNIEKPEWLVPVYGKSDLILKVHLITKDNKEIEQEQAVGSQQTLILINQPSDMYRIITIMLQDPMQRFDVVDFEIESAGGMHHSSYSLSTRSPDAHWSMLRQDNRVDYRYRLKKIMSDARIIEQDWLEGKDSLLVIGDTEIRIKEVDIVVLGAVDSLGAMLVLTSLDAPEDISAMTEIFLEAGQDQVKIKMPYRKDSAGTYRISGQVFTLAGDKMINELEGVSELAIVEVF